VSTQINVTVGSGGLSDKAKQLQAAARQAQLEKERTAQIEEDSTEQRNARLAANGQAPDGSALYGVASQLPVIERRPAANRRGVYELILRPDIEDPLLNYPARIKNAKNKPVIFQDYLYALQLQNSSTSLADGPFLGSNSIETRFDESGPASPRGLLPIQNADFNVNSEATVPADFTLEFWFYIGPALPPTTTAYRVSGATYNLSGMSHRNSSFLVNSGHRLTILETRTGDPADTTPGSYSIDLEYIGQSFNYSSAGDGIRILRYSHNFLTDSSSITDNDGSMIPASYIELHETWHHFAISQKSGQIKVFLDGVDKSENLVSDGAPVVFNDFAWLQPAGSCSSFRSTPSPEVRLSTYSRIADFRFIKKALYAESFEPSPLV
jgi:hypothetical protein